MNLNLNVLPDARPDWSGVPGWARKGKIVKLRNGRTGLKVVGLTKNHKGRDIIHCVYSGNDDLNCHADQVRPYDAFKPYHGSNSYWSREAEVNEQKELEEMKKLYTWKNSTTNADRFGHRLAINSSGNWVMELRGTGGEIETVDKALITVVMPHSVTVSFVTDNSGRTYDYWAPKGKLNVGDVVVMASVRGEEMSVVRVVGVDTNSEKANKHLSGTVLQGWVLTADTDD